MCDFPSSFAGVPVAVLGYGRSGRAATDFLLSRGARVSVYTERVDAKTAKDLAARGAILREGAFPARFDERVLVRSPVVRPDLPPILAALSSGAVLTDEVGLFCRFSPAHLVCVTGSDGKTTTTALVGAILSAAGARVFVGGNNGSPLLARVEEMREGDVAAAELSSFQLMTNAPRSKAAILTNLTPNHLDWHADFAEYSAAKMRIFTHTARAVIHADLFSLSAAIPPETPKFFFSFEERNLPLGARDALLFVRGENAVVRQGGRESEFSVFGSFALKGKHYAEDLLAAIGALYGSVPPEAILRGAADFRGVRHRMEYVGTVRGVAFYDSSIDTSPTRTAAALAALPFRPVVIAGGRGKGLSLLPLGDTLASHAKAVFLYGDTREEIFAAIGGRVPAVCFEKFADAFAGAAGAAKKGDAVVLSPGCTAFGEFRDFEERGEVFCRLVGELSR